MKRSILYAGANIPPNRIRKAPFSFSSRVYRNRNLVERFFDTIEHDRCIATLRPIPAPLAYLMLASALIWIREIKPCPMRLAAARLFAAACAD